MPQLMKKSNKYVGHDLTYTKSVVNALRSQFELSPHCIRVYKNFDFSKELLCWIYDGNEDSNVVGYKKLQSYPYDVVQFNEGDYVHFDYYHEGKITTWLIVGMDSVLKEELIGRIRHCTNELRFLDDDGILRRVPVVVDDKQTGIKNTEDGGIFMASGSMPVYAQLNTDSVKIKKNMRFLLGNKNNWNAWSVSASGINNIMNTYYDDNDSAKILKVTLEVSTINESTDDLINGVANSKALTEAEDLPLIVPPVEQDVYDIVISPNSLVILQGGKKEFTCVLSKNGIVQDDSFFFTDATKDVPASKYSFEIVDGKTFSITNISKHITSSPQFVIIKCQSEEITKNFNFTLKGVF